MQGLLEMSDRFIHLPLLEKEVAQIVMGISEVGLDLQGLLEMSLRFLRVAGGKKNATSTSKIRNTSATT